MRYINKLHRIFFEGFEDLGIADPGFKDPFRWTAPSEQPTDYKSIVSDRLTKPIWDFLLEKANGIFSHHEKDLKDNWLIDTHLQIMTALNGDITDGVIDSNDFVACKQHAYSIARSIVGEEEGFAEL